MATTADQPSAMAMEAVTGDTDMDMETDRDMEVGTDMEMAMDMTIAVGDFRGASAPSFFARGALLGFRFYSTSLTAPLTVEHDCRPIGNDSLQR
jgi:hypothetical protein